jgi:hypothetical protein
MTNLTNLMGDDPDDAMDTDRLLSSLNVFILYALISTLSSEIKHCRRPNFFWISGSRGGKSFSLNKL